MEVRVTAYEEWMRGQVADLFFRVYGGDRVAFAERFARFYEHAYQKERCFRIAAIHGNRVVGFMAFCYWPYVREGRRFHSLQACDAAVDAEFRRAGHFVRMLAHADEQRERLNADFYVAFPVRASRNGFLRAGWNNILDLQWYVKVRNPFAFLCGSETKALTEAFARTRPVPLDEAASRFRLSADPDFLEWRDQFMDYERRFFHDAETAQFEMKANRRRGLLRELIIGDVRSSAADSSALARALADVERKSRRVTFLSCAISPSDQMMSAALAAAGFRKIHRTIRFVVKSFVREPLVMDPAQWTLFRSDVDTW